MQRASAGGKRDGSLDSGPRYLVINQCIIKKSRSFDLSQMRNAVTVLGGDWYYHDSQPIV